MHIFIDPAIVMFPPIDTDADTIMDHIDQLVDWSRLMNDHSFYISEQCRTLIYHQRPPTRDELEPYWNQHRLEDYGYSLHEVIVACNQLFTGNLTTIESIEASIIDPLFESEAVQVNPDSYWQRDYSDELRDALRDAFGKIASFSEVGRDNPHIFRSMGVASNPCDCPALDVQTQLYILYGDDSESEKTLSVAITLPLLCDPEQLIAETYFRRRIRGKTILLIGGHQNFYQNLQSLVNDLEFDLRWLSPDDKGRVGTFIDQLRYIDGLIVNTSYSNHVIDTVRREAVNRKKPIEMMNTQGQDTFRIALETLMDKIDATQ